MPTKIEKDSVTGRETTGHEWDGIKELNTPLPKWWLYVLYACIIWSVIYMVLYPAIPGFSGLIGDTNRDRLDARMAEVAESRASFLEGIRTASLEEIQDKPELFGFARAGGAAAFADNCAPCHGPGGAGQGIYPVLADDDWLWGGTIEDIEASLLHGIRWPDSEETRDSQMPAFGDDYLEREDILAVTEHVLAMTGGQSDDEAAARGAEIYAEECSACHGESGEGVREVGGPRLNDEIWLYGGSKEELVAQISQPQHGQMPAWANRLDEETIKMLAIYVHSLGGGE
jgi:cytochrome c oxidase cbb3-type subunit 3